MNQIRLILLVIIFIPTLSFATDYYMAPASAPSGWSNGSDSNNGLSKSTPVLTLQYGLSLMSAGDTLTIADGTYTGSSNSMNVDHHPPTSTTLWTTVKAENRGGVLFDGENVRNMAYIDFNGTSTNCHWVFDGLIWGRSSGSSVNIYYGNYVKILNCGAYDTGAGNTVNFSLGHSSYNLIEGSYAWGSGRYKFILYVCDKSIIRNCVARSDRVDTTGAPNPMAQIAVYSSTDSFVQNSISIDSDQTTYYNANEYNGIYVPVSVADSNTVVIENSIILNGRSGGLSLDTNTYHATNCTVKNMVVWDTYQGTDSSIAINRIAGSSNTISHMTFGVGVQNTASGGYVFNGYGGTGDSFSDSLVYSYSGTGSMFYSLTNNYNYYQSNTVTNNHGGANDVTTTDYIWTASNTSGGLKYLPRIESGSNLSGNASDSGDIGANLTYLIGTSGTIWGETGYDTETTTPMWPFPNEALIKTKMQAYTYDSGNLTGDRGFASSTAKQLDGTTDVTLTSYIWEYLGNAIPSDIYGSTSGIHFGGSTHLNNIGTGGSTISF